MARWLWSISVLAQLGARAGQTVAWQVVIAVNRALLAGM
jgi:hypothetical protein